MEDRTLCIKIPAWLYDKLKAEAKSKCTSLASIVRMICVEYFEGK